MKIMLNRYERIALVGGLVASVIAAGMFLIVAKPGGSGVLASLRLDDGSEYLITQSCNWSIEPYTVSFYMRSGTAAPWGWCYVDHEADPWREVVMNHNSSTDEVIVTEQGVPRARLDRKRNVFWIDNGDISRELAAPQGHYPPHYQMP